jgi:hypothetical protein
MCVLDQWQRAHDQLKVCGELDAGTLAMVNTYSAALQCEAVREAVFAGRNLPHVFGPPTAWVALLAQALQIESQGHAEQAAALRAQAFDQAPASPGQADGQVFAWLADADSRLGPVLEVIINGRYGWLPLGACAPARHRAGGRFARPGLGSCAHPVHQWWRNGGLDAFSLCRQWRHQATPPCKWAARRSGCPWVLSSFVAWGSVC